LAIGNPKWRNRGGDCVRPAAWEHGYATPAGVRVHFVAAGPTTGPPVLLLHGFPEFWYGWRHQLPALAAAGFRAVAPDGRGYNLSDKPPRVADYAIERLVADVVGLARALGGRVSLVGHDWGGVVAWFVAMRHPEVVERLAILNAPHPAAYFRELRRSLAQPARSWYTVFFQLPWLPEAVALAGDCAVMRQTLRRDPARPGAFSDRDVAEYVRAWSHPRAMTCAINYYRAAFRNLSLVRDRTERIDCPTLLVWGMRDRYLVPALADGLETWVPQLRVERLPHASHWVQHDEPDTVNRLLIEFLTGRPLP
jgi:pimeloyl-ACP methyl ester carboxylesterase